LIRGKYSLESRVWIVISWLSAIALAPLLFVAGFYSHHDGLILANVRLLREAIAHGGQWPFNQYGSFGILPQTWFSYLFPAQYQLLGIRIFTLLCYWSAGYLVFKLSRLFVSKNVAHLALILFFISQPFNGSNFIPSASSFLMPVLIGQTYLIAKLFFDKGDNVKGQLGKTFLAGCLLPVLLLTRAQIGVFTFFVSSIFIFFILRFRGFITYLIGILIPTIVFAIFMTSHGWLIPSLFDEFIFGSLYVRYEDVSNIPVPIFSGLGTVILLLFFISKRKLWRYLTQNFSKRTILGLLITIFGISALFVIYVMYSRRLGINAAYFIVLGRFWISLYLSCLLYFLYSLSWRNYLAVKNSQDRSRDLLRDNFLIFTALAAQFQIWPFFDSMHFWWGSVPAVVIVAMVISKEFSISHLNLVMQKRIKTSITVLVIALIIMPWVTAAQVPRNALSLYGTQGIYINNSDAILNKNTRDFLEKNLKDDSIVLNLCQNPDVFLTEKNIRSATRYFIFWPHMKHVDSIQKSFENSKPELIVTCTLNEFNTDTQVQAEQQKQEILEKVAPDRKLRAAVEVGKVWEVWNIR
jgi:hypothetical protein